MIGTQRIGAAGVLSLYYSCTKDIFRHQWSTVAERATPYTDIRARHRDGKDRPLNVRPLAPIPQYGPYQKDCVVVGNYRHPVHTAPVPSYASL